MAQNDVDVKLRLVVDSKTYSAAMRQANKEAREFKRQQSDAFKAAAGVIGKAFGNAIGVLGKFTPALSAGAAALAVAQKAMQESQTLTDEWGRVTESARASWEGFVNTLAFGDFSGFFSNMREIVRSAREAYDALDAIGTANIFYDKAMMESELAIRQARFTIKSPDSTAEEKKAAGEVLEREQNKQIASAKQFADVNMRGFAAKLAEQLTKKGLRVSAEDFVTTDAEGRVVAKAGSLYDKYYRDLSTYTDWDTKYRVERQKRGFYWNGSAWIKGEGALIGRGKGDMSDAAFEELSAVMEQSDNNLKEAFGLLQQAWRAENEVLTKSIENFEYLRNANNIVGGIGGNKAIAAPAAEGSIAYVQEQLKKAEDERIRAVELEERKVAEARIKVLKEELAILETGRGLQMQSLVSGNIDALNLNTTDILPPTWRAGQTEVKTFNKVAKTAFDNINGLADVIDRLGVVSLFTGSQVDETTAIIGKMLSLFGSVVGGPFGAIVGGIGSLISGGGFATGGIVGGTSYKGDRLTAQVSSGEMILNKMQQRNLLAIAGGGGAPAVTAVEVRGDKMVLLINNTLRSQGKSTIG